MARLAVIVVSYNSRGWLERCISSVYAAAGDAGVEVIVVDNDSSNGSADYVDYRFPRARLVRGQNRGFAYGNNRGLTTADAPYVLLFNPDAEIVDGKFDDLLGWMADRPEVGLVGCRQIDFAGRVFPSIRRFPEHRAPVPGCRWG